MSKVYNARESQANTETDVLDIEEYQEEPQLGRNKNSSQEDEDVQQDKNLDISKTVIKQKQCSKTNATAFR